jgi:hypothetical protein
VIDTTNPQSPLYNSINATCMINGKYDIDITNFGCIGKKFRVIVSLKLKKKFLLKGGLTKKIITIVC